MHMPMSMYMCTSVGEQVLPGLGTAGTPMYMCMPMSRHMCMSLGEQVLPGLVQSGRLVPAEVVANEQHHLASARSCRRRAGRAACAASVASDGRWDDSLEASRERSHTLTYDEEQQKAAARRMTAAHDHGTHRLLFSERLARIRRGQQTKHASPASHRPPSMYGRGTSCDSFSKSRKSGLTGEPMSPSFVKPPSHRPAKPPAGSYEASASAFESYQYEEEESKVHIDLRETMRQDKRWARHYWTLLVMNLIIVVAIGGDEAAPELRRALALAARTLGCGLCLVGRRFRVRAPLLRCLRHDLHSARATVGCARREYWQTG